MIKAFVFDAYGTLYDVQSVADVTDAAFPGYGEYITQVWRMKQLEYSWLRSMMGDYKDFWTITLESLEYTLHTIGLKHNAQLIEDIAQAYNRLTPYPDAREALQGLADYRRAILSNGSPDMLSKLVSHSGFERLLERTLSVDGKRVFKPDPRAYEIVEQEFGLRRDEIAFVSSNGFDVCGAKHFGFRVIRIERVSASAMNDEIRQSQPVGPSTVFKALRTQQETCGAAADFQIAALAELPALVRSRSWSS